MNVLEANLKVPEVVVLRLNSGSASVLHFVVS
jgi:hypothetical protein